MHDVNMTVVKKGDRVKIFQRGEVRAATGIITKLFTDGLDGRGFRRFCRVRLCGSEAGRLIKCGRSDIELLSRAEDEHSEASQ